MQLQSKIVVIATRNQGKVKEFAKLFSAIGKEVRSLRDYEDLPDVVEDGVTFADNALKKAKTIAEVLGIPVLADDSGLCVDALDGAPGIYSARYAGEQGNDKDNNRKLLEELHNKGAFMREDASAHGPVRLLSPAKFVCSLSLYDPEHGTNLTANGECPGFIIEQPRGEHGFGYDPLFYLPEYKQTMAELSMEEKNRISHRGNASKVLMDKLLD